MPISRVGLPVLVAWVLALWVTAVWGQTTLDVDPDADAYIRAFPSAGVSAFTWITPDQPHRVGIRWRTLWILKWQRIWRSYVHFPVAEIPSCFVRVVLRLQFQDVWPLPVSVEIYAVEWDGKSSFAWDGQPASYWGTTVSVPDVGWCEVDVTPAVQQALDLGREVAFMVRLSDEEPDWNVGQGWSTANFVDPRLSFQLCQLDVSVTGLSDFSLTQNFISGNRYAPLGDLQVKVSTDVPYETRVCYDVSPEPVPAFSADPVELAYARVWIAVPRCPAYVPLPGFSGNPGDEGHSYPVRVDLADLGDRAAAESFTFVLRVWAVPR